MQDSIHRLERDLLAWYRSNDLARRIATVPGVGLLGATALEPRRDFRRLQLLRDWSHDEAYPTLFP